MNSFRVAESVKILMKMLQSESFFIEPTGGSETDDFSVLTVSFFATFGRESGFSSASLSALLKFRSEAFLYPSFSPSVKALEGKQIAITGYFLDEELIGFSTAMISNKKMDANFVGLDYQYNSEYALYQRMLYDFVDLSITENLKELRLGRTAEEIKSCLGAKPIDMKLFIKHKNTVPNTILKQMIKSVKPSEFVLRKPFKANFI